LKKDWKSHAYFAAIGCDGKLYLISMVTTTRTRSLMVVISILVHVLLDTLVTIRTLSWL